MGSRAWYAIKYEDIVNIIAPRFEIVRQKVSVNYRSVLISFVAKQGVTPPERIIHKESDFYLGALRVNCRGQSSLSRIRRRRSIDPDELPTFTLLSSLYPNESDIVKSEFRSWIQNTQAVKKEIAAAKLLWLCRINGMPISLRELAKDFCLRTRSLSRVMLDVEYVPPLSVEHYVDRLTRAFKLDASHKAKILEILSGVENCLKSSALVEASSAVIVAARSLALDIKVCEVAKHMGISTAAIRTWIKKMNLVEQ